MERRFAGQTVVITGGCRGIGEGIAERFGREGANLVLVSNAERVHDTAARLATATGAEVLPLVVDITDEAAVADLYAQAEARFGRVDVSVQNAGIITIDAFDRMPRADFDRILQVNTTGVWLCCREAAKRMVAAGRGGRLINTSSGQGRQGFIYTPHYAASKMGVIGITQSLAHELARHGITVNAFCPGIIESEMWDYNDRVWGEILSTPEKGYGQGELMAEWVGNIPLKRAGTPCRRRRPGGLPRVGGRGLHHRPGDQCGWWPDHVLIAPLGVQPAKALASNERLRENSGKMRPSNR